MLDPSKRFITLVLALGILVLGLALALGERMGDRVIGQVTEKRLTSIAPITVTPTHDRTTVPYGPDWKRSQVLAAAADPAFADPRVPPVPLPTSPPPPTPGPNDIKPAAQTRAIQTPRPTPSPTPNLNLPIWRRAKPLPTATPATAPGAQPTASSQPQR